MQSKPDAPPRPAAGGWLPHYMRLWRLLSGVAVVVLLLCLRYDPIPSHCWRDLGVFALLAILASLLPVELPGSNISTSPLVPIVFASAGLFGATAAVLVDVVSSLVEIALTSSRSSRFFSRRLVQGAATPTVTTGLCALLYSLLHRTLFPGGGITEHPQFVAWAALSACALLAFVANAALSTLLASRFHGWRWDVLWHNNVRWMLPSAVLMSPVSFLMAVLYHGRPLWGIAFVVFPLYAMRMAVVYHKKTSAAYKQGVDLLGRIMQEAHPYTHGHLHRVARWAIKIAEKMQLPPESLQFIGDAAILHDIGKVAVDDRVLNKIGKLTDDEWAMIRRHPVVGADLVVRMQFMHRVAFWIRHHHERPDGTGYPDRLPEDQIPVESAIISVVDAFDAMVGGPAKEDQRPYRKSMTPDAAIAELRRHAGTQFHERVVEVFIEILHAESLAEPREEQAGAEDSLWEAPPSMPEPVYELPVAGGRR